MRYLLFIVLLWAGSALAAPPKPNAKEVAKEARAIYDEAEKEPDLNKAKDLRTQACAKWEEAFTLSRHPEYQLALGLCYRQIDQIPLSEAALRTFLGLAPTTHPRRSLAEQALIQIQKEQDAEKAKNPPALRIEGPLPVVLKDPLPVAIVSAPTEESPKQWKRAALFAGGTLGGLGLVAGAVAFGVIRSQEETGTPGGQGGVVEVQP